MTLRFGTDGVRGVANAELTPELALALGRAAARALGGSTFVVGRDTRRSGALLEAALVAGLAAEGVDVRLAGIVPTPAVAAAAAASGAAGAMISASHNPFGDNGIKLFAPGGRKLPDDIEAGVEAHWDALLQGSAVVSGPTGAAVGDVRPAPEVGIDWAEAVIASLEGRHLSGLHVVLDCANGAASVLGPDVFERLGAQVEVLHARPDGTNINDACGSTYPADLQAAVVAAGAQLGLAFDGDADRVLAVDAAGQLVDGDQIIAMCALDRHQRGSLRGDAVVVTVMTNLGFRLAMSSQGIEVVETAVGDRYVLDALDERSLSLGGEQSGHVIFRDLATTGDGVLTGVQIADVMRRSGRPLAELASVMTRLPQVLRNVPVATRGMDVSGLATEAVHAAEVELGATGRILLRSSGTESVVRVMVEAPTEELAAQIAGRVAAAVAEASPA